MTITTTAATEAATQFPSSFRDCERIIVQELADVLDHMDETQIDALVNLIANARKVFFVGVGRVAQVRVRHTKHHVAVALDSVSEALLVHRGFSSLLACVPWALTLDTRQEAGLFQAFLAAADSGKKSAARSQAARGCPGWPCTP